MHNVSKSSKSESRLAQEMFTRLVNSRRVGKKNRVVVKIIRVVIYNLPGEDHNKKGMDTDGSENGRMKCERILTLVSTEPRKLHAANPSNVYPSSHTTYL